MPVDVSEPPFPTMRLPELLIVVAFWVVAPMSSVPDAIVQGRAVAEAPPVSVQVLVPVF